jgi:ribosomal protein S24E
MHEEERYCPLCDKRETRSECSYGEKAWDKVSVKDEEYSMARSELKTIEDAVKRIKSKVGKGEGDLEAWVQSKITKAADYIDTAADYIASGEMEESFGYEIDPEKHKKTKMSSAAKKIDNMTTAQQAQLPQKAKKVVGVTLPKFEETLVDKITREILDEKCWAGYKRKKGTKEFDKGSCVKAEDVTIEDANGNTFAEVVDIIKPEPIRGFKSQVSEATRLQAQTGNVIAVTLSWRGKYYSLKMFFPQVKTPSRKEINDELQKVYPGSVVIYHSISEIHTGQPLIQMCGPQGGSSAKPGPSKAYIKTMGEEVELEEEGPSLSVGRGEKLPVSRGGGLTKKGREKYNRATGSNLQAPVTGDVEPGSRAAKRRKAFCSRSISWKGERGLAARRRWKC